VCAMSVMRSLEQFLSPCSLAVDSICFLFSSMAFVHAGCRL